VIKKCHIHMPRQAAKKQKTRVAPQLPEDMDPSTFHCTTCSQHSVKGAVWSAKCRDCGMAIFFKTVAACRDYRKKADAEIENRELYD
jgi:hypothetical protein